MELKARSLRFWPQESGYQALIRDREAAKATVIVFHGNAGSALHRDYYANALGRQGYRVIITEYPGYGGRPGKPGEETFVSAGIDVLNKARETFGGPIYLLGSLSAAALRRAWPAGRMSRLKGSYSSPPSTAWLLWPAPITGIWPLNGWSGIALTTSGT